MCVCMCVCVCACVCVCVCVCVCACGCVVEFVLRVQGSTANHKKGGGMVADRIRWVYTPSSP